MRRFRKKTDGDVVVLFALLMPVLMGAGAGAIDYAGLVKRRSELVVSQFEFATSRRL
jgi:Flp pilus assembly protein TadG